MADAILGVSVHFVSRLTQQRPGGMLIQIFDGSEPGSTTMASFT